MVGIEFADGIAWWLVKIVVLIIPSLPFCMIYIYHTIFLGENDGSNRDSPYQARKPPESLATLALAWLSYSPASYLPGLSYA
jgi:hypothetical protein